jgi:PTH1 family peptidyl-tRNA hydrolase
MESIRLLVGLGNPGAEHERTRHNAGFWWLDAVAADAGLRLGYDAKIGCETARGSVAGQPVLVAKPQKYMNASGLPVRQLLAYYKVEPEAMLVAHDDLDLPAGTARLKFDGGHGGQNGLRDIIAHLGHGRFHRLRIGIGHPGRKDQVTSWVLGRPGKADEVAIHDAIAAARAVLPQVLAGRIGDAMQTLHTPRPAG